MTDELMVLQHTMNDVVLEAPQRLCLYHLLVTAKVAQSLLALWSAGPSLQQLVPPGKEELRYDELEPGSEGGG